MILSPFIHHEGRWYIILGWERGMTAGKELLLRMLTDEEARLLESYRENFDAEAWALIRGKDQ